MLAIIKASAPGEFTNVSYAVVNLAPEYTAKLVADIEQAAALKAADDNFYCFEKWDGRPDVYAYIEDADEFLGDSDWRFISEEKLKELLGDTEPQRLDAVRRTVAEDEVQWRGYIKHDDREWSTSQITKEDLLAHFTKGTAT